MSWRALAADAPLRRHTLVRVRADAWPGLLAAHGDAAHLPYVRQWAARGWPLIVRRGMPGEAGVALGLPLPPSAGKRRIALAAAPAQIAAIRVLPALTEVERDAPLAWRPTLANLRMLADAHRVDCRVFGSLGWQALTGLRYLHEQSDLDIVLTPRAAWRARGVARDAAALAARDRPGRGRESRLPTDDADAARGRDAAAGESEDWADSADSAETGASIAALVAALADLDARAPMRIDGELLRADGAGVNWRELHAGAREVAVKTADGVALCAPEVFLETWR
ncbi:malonate decarboxylase holo-[acyl-carrier-protein] synthase [Burkholderia sp. TSV86]|uniref:malonate decarboxylase holo-[acyl-carrier-protein] synthase n=1 Tax=Burkholderia sp. TSV86 TaxID=1385594 RepID=UPI00075464F7|nr:malonate decarboxylase holo-[acyl-carrier-protein] synthase [Burkholderia sp. TSV86]KVE36598.1 phosphoribosyl-dephospho-CoA transferase [Burkholderia sp. TSV86]